MTKKEQEKYIIEACKRLEKANKGLKCDYEFNKVDNEWCIMYSEDIETEKFLLLTGKIRKELKELNILVAIFADEVHFEKVLV